MSKRISREEGIFAGLSCGAACIGALKVAEKLIARRDELQNSIYSVQEVFAL